MATQTELDAVAINRLAEGWPLAKGYYARMVNRCPQTFVREVFWDNVVDALLQTLREFDGSLNFQWQFKRQAWRAWINAMRWSQRSKRRFDHCRLDEEKLGRPSSGYELVEGRELYLALLPILEPRQRARIERWLHGEREADIARADGVTPQTINGSIRSGIERLRKAV